MKEKNVYTIDTGTGIAGVASRVWTAMSSDKITTAMILVTVLGIVGVVVDSAYTLSLDRDSVRLGPKNK